MLGSGKGRAWSGTGHNHTGRGGRTQRACHHGAWAWAWGGGRQGQDGLGAASCGDQRVWKGPLSQGATPSDCWVHRAGPAGLEAGSEQGRWGVGGWSTQRTQPLGGPRPPMACPGPPLATLTSGSSVCLVGRVPTHRPLSRGLPGAFLREAPSLSRQQTRPARAGAGGTGRSLSEAALRTQRGGLVGNVPFLQASRLCLFESLATSFLCESHARRGPRRLRVRVLPFMFSSVFVPL